MPDRIVPIVLTYNESANVSRTLAALSWAENVLIVDSFSTDGTVEIAKGFPNVTVIQHPFESFGSQWQFAREQTQWEWLLALDADCVLTPELVEELQALRPEPAVSGYRIGFIYCVHGKPLRGSLLPPRVMLVRRSSAEFYDEGHAHRVRVSGEIQTLRGKVLHDDRKPLGRWLEAQHRYSEQEAARLIAAPAGTLRLQDRLRKGVLFAPLLVGLYALLGKGLLLDGRYGWYYVLQRVYAEILLALRLLEHTLERAADRAQGQGSERKD